MRRLKRTDQLDLFGGMTCVAASVAEQIASPMDDRSSVRPITLAEARQLWGEDTYRIACGEPWPEVLAERQRKRGDDVG